MTKKTRKSFTKKKSNNVVRAAFDENEWSPLGNEIDNNRDKKYVKNVKARSIGQEQLLKLIDEHHLTIASGPAGTGKTYLAISKAVEALENGRVDKIILSRPAMEAGESIGYLPGDLQEKMAPFLRPLYDALGDRMGGRKVKKLIDEGIIEIAPVGYMRGRTLNNAFVVIDEAQNCTYQQIKMLLSRLGWHSTMVVTGDPAQSDLLEGMSGFADIIDKLEAVKKVGIVKLQSQDIVRHPLVAEMLEVI